MTAQVQGLGGVDPGDGLVAPDCFFECVRGVLEVVDAFFTPTEALLEDLELLVEIVILLRLHGRIPCVLGSQGRVKGKQTRESKEKGCDSTPPAGRKRFHTARLLISPNVSRGAGRCRLIGRPEVPP